MVAELGPHDGKAPEGACSEIHSDASVSSSPEVDQSGGVRAAPPYNPKTGPLLRAAANTSPLCTALSGLARGLDWRIILKGRPVIMPGALAALCGLVVPGCVSCTERDVLLRERVDLSTPERAFETLRAAIRCDDAHTGYLVLSEAMKRREQIDESLFRLGWDEFFRLHPSARLAGNAEIQAAKYGEFPVPGAADSAGSPNVCRLTVSAYGKALQIEFARQDYYKVTLRWSGKVIDGYLASTGAVVRKPEEAARDLLLQIKDRRLESVSIADIASITVASEWAVLGFLENAGP